MKNILLGLLLALLVSCQQNDLLELEAHSASVCNTTDPVHDLPWLKAMIEDSDKPTANDVCSLMAVRQGNYQGQTVFITSIGGALCCPCAGSAVYNCQGELVFVCNLTEEKKIKNHTIIWQRK